MRGKLINPFKVLLARYDTTATAANTSGGQQSGGFDPDFREPTRNPTTGKSARSEYAPVLLPCQVEVGTYDAQQMQSGGDDPDGRIVLVYHFRDLEGAGLVAANGVALLRPNDRLVSIHRYDDETLIQSFEPADAPDGGYFCTEAQPQSFGLRGGARNLLLCTYVNRDRTFKGGT